MNREYRPLVMSPDGISSDSPPDPGISNSKTTSLHRGSALREMEKSADFEFKEPVEESQLESLMSNFNVTPIGLGQQGYVVHIPLKMGKVAQSAIKNGKPTPKLREKYKEIFQDEEPYEEINLKNLSDEEVMDEEESEKEASETIPQMGALPSGDITMAKLPARRLNAAMPDRELFPAQGKVRISPKSTVMSHIDKAQYDTERKTSIPWDQFKKVVASEKVTKLANALGVQVQPYVQQNPMQDPNTPAVVLDVLMLGHFNTEWLEWEPETLRAVLQELNVHPYNLEKLQALQVMHSNDSFWDDESAFEKVALALNNITPNFRLRQDLNVAQMAKAVAISRQLKKKDFSDEVTKHIAVRAHLEGLVVLPIILSFAQPVLDTLQPSASGLVPQVTQAYLAKWPASESQDTLSVQLRKLYAIDEFLNL